MKTLRLTDCDFAAAAERLGTDVPSLRAVHEVETGSSNGFWAPGKPIILFEGHVFWKQLEQRGISPAPLAAGNESILYPRWTRRYYGTEREEYARLAREQPAQKQRQTARARDDCDRPIQIEKSEGVGQNDGQQPKHRRRQPCQPDQQFYKKYCHGACLVFCGSILTSLFSNLNPRLRKTNNFLLTE